MSHLLSREKQILCILVEDSSASVAQISEQLGVSVVTIRGDLKTLADKGLIIRTRGGAFPAFHPAILERQKKMANEKERIAKAAAARVEDRDNIFIAAGTTPCLIVKYLLGKRDVHIVSNSTLIFPYTRINPALKLTLVGGEFSASGEALTGPSALESLARFHVNKAFLGTDGFSAAGGITADAVEMAEIIKIATAQSNQSLLLADSSKYGRKGFAHIMGLNHVDYVITDTGLPTKAQQEIQETGLQIEQV